jgi:hypothetical protein
MTAKNKLIFGVFLLVLPLLLVSCGKAEYGDYHVGMYINEVEYHERQKGFFASPVQHGFTSTKEKSKKNVFIHGYCPELTPNGRRSSKTEFGFNISLCIDSTQFNVGTKYYFNEKNITKRNVHEIFSNNDSVENSLLSGYVIFRYGEKYLNCEEKYWVKEGWILLGDYVNYIVWDVNTSYYLVIEYHHFCSTFEFYVENEEGKGLHITNGFCKHDEII